MTHSLNQVATSIPVSALIDLFVLFFWMALVVVTCFIVLILHKAYQTMKDVRAIVADNRKNINLILDEVPQITKNVAEVTTEVSHVTQVFRPTIDNVAQTSDSITHTFKDNNTINEILISAYKTISNIRKLVDSINPKSSGTAKSTSSPNTASEVAMPTEKDGE